MSTYSHPRGLRLAHMTSSDATWRSGWRRTMAPARAAGGGGAAAAAQMAGRAVGARQHHEGQAAATAVATPAKRPAQGRGAAAAKRAREQRLSESDEDEEDEGEASEDEAGDDDAFDEDDMVEEDDEDDDDDEGEEDEDVLLEDEDAVAMASRRKIGQESFSKYYKPPTHEELQRLKETEELFHSNIMRMEVRCHARSPVQRRLRAQLPRQTYEWVSQIAELMNEVSVDRTKLPRVDAALHRLKALVDRIEATKPMDLPRARSYLAGRGVALPFDYVSDATSVQWKLQYLPPTAVHVVGSYLLQTTARPVLNVDVALEMPAVRSARDAAHLAPPSVHS